jgi:hypothetical protein
MLDAIAGIAVREEDQWPQPPCPRRCSRLIRGPLSSTAMCWFAASTSAAHVRPRVRPAPTPAWRRTTSSSSASASGSALTAPTSAMPPAAFSPGRRSTKHRLLGHRFPHAGIFVPCARRSASGMPRIMSTAVSVQRNAGDVKRPVRQRWTLSGNPITWGTPPWTSRIAGRITAVGRRHFSVEPLAGRAGLSASPQPPALPAAN